MWQHDTPDYPVEMGPELAADRYPTRIKERWASGACECWSHTQRVPAAA
ncbi:hypothetical protein [Hymenobacter wooponensis]